MTDFVKIERAAALGCAVWESGSEESRAAFDYALDELEERANDSA